MYEFNEILEKYAKNLKYLEISSLCFLKNNEFVHLASHIQFVEIKGQNVNEQKNSLLFLRSYVQVDERMLDRFFADMKEGILRNNGVKISLSINFNYDKLLFNYYQRNGRGYFQLEFYGKNQQGIGNELMRGIYSFGSSSFQTISKEKLGFEIANPDGSIYILLPVNISGGLEVKSKTEGIIQMDSEFIDETFDYSLRFFNVRDVYGGENSDCVVKGSFKQINNVTAYAVPITIEMLSEYNTVTLEIFDTNIGIMLFSKFYKTSEVLARSHVLTSVLYEAYSIFRNPEDFTKSLLLQSSEIQKQKPQSRFELEMSILLNCGGLQSIWLEKNDSVKNGSITIASADILAYDDRTCELYVVSCKTGTPVSDETTNKVVDAAIKIKEYLRRSEVKVRPCIATLQQIDETPFMRSKEVILLNRAKIEELAKNKSKFTLT